MTAGEYFQSWLGRQGSLQALWAQDPGLQGRSLTFARQWLESQTQEVAHQKDFAQERSTWETGNWDPVQWDQIYPQRAGSWRWLSQQVEAGNPVAREVLLRQGTEALTQRQDEALRRNLAQRLPDFRQELTLRMKKLSQAEKTLESIFGKRDLGWDLSHGDWQDLDLSLLMRWGDHLAKEREIQRIAQLIGRDYRAKSRPSEPPPVVPPRKHDVPEAGKVEVRGITQGGSLSDALSTELALLTFPETETVFLKKYAEGELLTQDYQAPQPPPRHLHRFQQQAQAVNERGPAIICLDTSGSMRGKPEEVAKLAVLALVKVCLSEGRRCFLINFSSDLRTLEVTDLKTQLREFLAFLSFSFHGGTDLPPALRRALTLMSQERWKEADVLVVSDFAVPKIPGELRSRIRQLQDTTGARFYALTISSRPLNDFLNIFDAAWVYSINQNRKVGIDPDSLHSLF